jgi:anti-sigma regulatory factor (Ser/Thr protein kinase)
MGTVALRFQPSAEHVRTARLVAVAVARRAGMDEARLDEIRLAVGEVCARAVRRCDAAGIRSRIVVEMHDGGPRLEVVVTDRADSQGGDEEPVALALVRGLADDVRVDDGPGGPRGKLSLSWAMPSSRTVRGAGFGTGFDVP